MSVDIGIIGLPQSGRTTIFNALTHGSGGGQRTQEGYHVGMAKVPEPRLKGLADILHPHRIVPATVRYIDVSVSLKDLVSSKGGGQLLAELTNVDALINVVRAFKDDSIPHVEGSIDVERDTANMDLELAFSDIALLERRLSRIEESLKGAKPQERQGLLREQALLGKIKTELEREVPMRSLELTDEDKRTLAGFQFLTAKPLLTVVNIGEDQLAGSASLEAELNSRHSRPKCRLLAVCGKIEKELAQLDDSEAQTLRSEFGIRESGADRIIKLSYGILGLISFFTIASGEVRAWSVEQGTEAVKAAGKIHSDMERGFIRAEVLSYDDLAGCGNVAESRKKGLLRSEGKSYIVKDGDVITFLFNV
ncbi:MAG: redox-regulated ATPase YchF [Chloroflexi bacterium]|nr:redox-regulated ATPase YchF [Chloroflexota bacterium]